MDNPIAITKRDRPCAYIISAEEYEDLKQLEEYEDLILGHMAVKALAGWMCSKEENDEMNKLIFGTWK